MSCLLQLSKKTSHLKEKYDIKVLQFLEPVKQEIGLFTLEEYTLLKSEGNRGSLFRRNRRS